MLPRQFYSLRQKINERMPHGPAVSTVYMLHEVYADGETPADAVCAVSLSRFTAWLDRLPADQVGTPELRRCGKSLRFSLRLRGITDIYAVPMHGTRTQWSSPCLYVSWPPHVSMCSRTAAGPPSGRPARSRRSNFTTVSTLRTSLMPVYAWRRSPPAFTPRWGWP